MAIVTLNQNILTAPGVYVGENSAGIAPVELATFNRAYMLGSALDGDFAVPSQITDITDAINQFGLLPASVNAREIELFFKNHPYGILYYSRVPIGALWQFTLGGIPVVGDEVILTINTPTPIIVTYVVSVAATASFDDLLDELIETINSDADVAAIAIAEGKDLATKTLKLRLLDPTITAPDDYLELASGVGDGVTVAGEYITATALHPSRADFLWAIAESFDPDEHSQGFLFAPEAFKYLEKQADRTSVGQALHDLASSEGFDWVALVDCGEPDLISTPAQAQTEGQTYSAPFGHLAYYYPYLIDTNEDELPPSGAVAAIALRRYQEQGFQQPPAGAKYPVRGVVDVKYRVKKAQQAVVNSLGINVVRYLPNTGVVVYGARSRSSNPLYRFINTRVILAVLIGTLRQAFDTDVFTAVDGQGILFSRLKETTNAVCYRLYIGGALYGATPEEAFFVKADRENNPALDLEAGVVRMDVFVVPSPTMERLLISVNRTAIGQIAFTSRGVD